MKNTIIKILIHKSIFLSLASSFVSINVSVGQIDIKSKVDNQTYSDYSQVLSLFEKYVSSDEQITLFVPINYSLQRLNKDRYNQIFIQNNKETSISFINTLIGAGDFSLSAIRSSLSSDLSRNIINLKSGNKIYYQVEDNQFLIGDSYLESNVKFEAHIIKSIKIADKILLNLLDGLINF